MSLLDRFFDIDIIEASYNIAPDILKAAVSNLLCEHEQHAFLFTCIDKELFLKNINDRSSNIEFGATTLLGDDGFYIPLFSTALAFFRKLESGPEMLLDLLAGITITLPQEDQLRLAGKIKELIRDQTETSRV
jgi:hypothetical protein